MSTTIVVTETGDGRVDELLERAKAGHARHAGRTFRVAAASLRCGDTTELRNFEPPILVRVRPVFDPLLDAVVRDSGDGPVVTTVYDVENLEPERLAADEVVLTVAGPVYLPGLDSVPAWTAAEEEAGACALTAALKADVGKLLGFRRRLRDLVDAAADFNAAVEGLAEDHRRVAELTERLQAAEAECACLRETVAKQAELQKGYAGATEALVACQAARDDAEAALAVSRVTIKSLETRVAELSGSLEVSDGLLANCRRTADGYRDERDDLRARLGKLRGLARDVDRLVTPVEQAHIAGLLRERFFGGGAVVPGATAVGLGELVRAVGDLWEEVDAS